MNREWLRLAELVALWSLGCGLLGLGGFMIHKGQANEAMFGAIITTLPLIFQTIRNLGQAQVMNNMAAALANSQPAPRQLPAPPISPSPDAGDPAFPEPAFGKGM